MFLQLGYLIVILCVSTHGGKKRREDRMDYSDVEFFWRKSSWGDKISPVELTIAGSAKCCDKCLERRQVYCVAAKNLKTFWTVPSRFCPSKRPASTREIKDCGLVQKCVVSEWSKFSPCSKTCGLNAVRYRSRRILIPPKQPIIFTSESSCPPLVEKVRCLENTPCYRTNITGNNDEFTWKIGPWTNCRAIQFHYGNYGFAPFPWEKHACGPGFKTRSVSCVNSNGQPVESRWCILSGAKQPITSEACSMPCDCKVTQWSSWSKCNKKCRETQRVNTSSPLSLFGKQDFGVMTRTRLIVIPPQHGGLSCPVLFEKNRCEESMLRGLPACPSYRWFSGEWGDCLAVNTEDLVTGRNNTACGPGKQKRQVFCVEDKGEDNLIPVDERFCLPESKSNDTFLTSPATARACHVPCPVHCEVGQWGSWSQCSKSCGEGGTKIRARPILREVKYGGDDCPALSQSTPCIPVPCSWWHTGRWSKCFLKWGLQSCGEGTQVRVRYCKSASNNWLPDRHCEDEVPLKEQNCNIPCPSDCVVSPWGAWSKCSKSCGTQGGLQTRDRQILASSGPNGTSCLSPDQFKQTRVCNQFVKCSTSYFWQVEQWGECSLSDGQDCGNGFNGIQRRLVYCTKENSNVVDGRFCLKSLKPTSVQNCTVQCPHDCLLSPWSDWSQCSKSCSNGHKVRTRRILQLPMHGGNGCPHSDEAGTITETDSCNEEVCYSYRWEEGTWSQCRPVPEVNGTFDGNPQCGPGFQVRNVSCVRSDGKHVEAGLCLKELFTIAPVKLQRCQIACSGDCVLSIWSTWSECSQFCGSAPGKRFRTRSVLNLNPLLGDWKRQCADVTETDLRQISSCNQRACPSYRWHTGRWRSCVVTNPPVGQYCGSGLQHRAVLCQQTDGQFVPEERCRNLPTPAPDQTRDCAIVCPQDCMVGEWSTFTPCSSHCGKGVRSRMRRVRKEARYGGRPCPPVIESTVCEEVPCHFVHWDVEGWSSCQIENGQCGTGIKTRDVKCDPYENNKKNCALQIPEPESIQSCTIACPGDCVLSEWGQWTECSNTYPYGGIQKRERTLIRNADDSGKPCSDLKQERVCNVSPPPDYKWVVGNWTSCQVGSTHGTGCGKGKQFRSRNCERSDGVIVDPEECKGSKAHAGRECVVDCPRDCIISEWTVWSSCSENCGLHGVKVRQRRIISQNSVGGRQCPPHSHLKEILPCHSFPCFTYSWHKSNWSACNVESGGCGFGLRTRSVECRRNDGIIVGFRFCIKESREMSGNYHGIGSAIGNDMIYNIETVQVCGTSCPGSCEIMPWGSWTPCRREVQLEPYGWVSDCQWDKGYQIRSRGIIWRESCKSLSYLPKWEKRPCALTASQCLTHRWRMGPWSDEGQRDVWCEENGINVTGPGACQFQEKPSENRLCLASCEVPNTVCKDGKCVCKYGFETIKKGLERICLPITSCVTNEHCPLTNTRCNNRGRCVCSNGYMKDKKGYCVPAPTNPPTTVSLFNSGTGTSTSKENATEEEVEVHFRERKSISDLWHWFLIGTGIILVLILLVIGFICWIQWESDHADITPPCGANNLTLLNKKGEPQLVSLEKMPMQDC